MQSLGKRETRCWSKCGGGRTTLRKPKTCARTHAHTHNDFVVQVHVHIWILSPKTIKTSSRISNVITIQRSIKIWGRLEEGPRTLCRGSSDVLGASCSSFVFTFTFSPDVDAAKCVTGLLKETHVCVCECVEKQPKVQSSESRPQLDLKSEL